VGWEVQTLESWSPNELKEYIERWFRYQDPDGRRVEDVFQRGGVAKPTMDLTPVVRL